MSPGPLKQAVVVITLVLAVLPVLSFGGSSVAATDCSRFPWLVRSAPGAGKTVALTFDDGPTRFTSQVLRTLRRNNVRATFFVTGRRAAAQPGDVPLSGGVLDTVRVSGF